MKKAYTYNIFCEIKNKIKEYFLSNKGYIFLVLVIVIISLVTGIFTGIKSSADISIVNCNDKVLVAFFEDDISIFSFFVKRVFGCICVLVVALLLSKTKLIIPISMIFISYFSFSLGLNIIVISLVFGVGGVINLVLVIVPIQIGVLSIYIFGSVSVIKDCLTISTYGKLTSCRRLYSKWLIIFVLLLVLCIIESLFINLTRASFIFII